MVVGVWGTMKELVAETDWLASSPVFYNEQTGEVSHTIGEVINWANVEIDAEGMRDYLDFGFAAFEQTPVRHVRFLRHSSRLWRGADNTLSIEYLEDPVEQWIGRETRESDVLGVLEERVRAWEDSHSREIVIPTSSGFDSRLLNLLVRDRARIRSFSYGISNAQDRSIEVQYARELSRALGTRWEWIRLGDFHQYLDEWDSLYGIATHSHGMYHLEFYSKLAQKASAGASVLSGIIGDAWAGSVSFPRVRTPDQLAVLAYTHGVRIDPHECLLTPGWVRREQYLAAKGEQLEHPLFRVVEAMRHKMILLSYLMRVPAHRGFVPWSPFLEIDVALSMLTLPEDRRRNRVWQREFFRKHGLHIDDRVADADRSNTLDLQGQRRHPVEPLSPMSLKGLVSPEYVAWVNQTLANLASSRLFSLWPSLARTPCIGGRWRTALSRATRAYSSYMVLRPVAALFENAEADGL